MGLNYNQLQHFAGRYFQLQPRDWIMKNDKQFRRYLSRLIHLLKQQVSQHGYPLIKPTSAAPLSSTKTQQEKSSLKRVETKVNEPLSKLIWRAVSSLKSNEIAAKETFLLYFPLTYKMQVKHTKNWNCKTCDQLTPLWIAGDFGFLHKCTLLYLGGGH